MDKARIFAGNSNRKLAEDIAKRLSLPLTSCELRSFANSETHICVNESVRGKDIYIIETGASTLDENGVTHTVNHHLMNLYLLAKTLRRSQCGTITAIIPNFPYARQDKKDSARGAICAADVCELLTFANVERLVCVELHNPCIQGNMPTSFDNLYTTDLIKDYCVKHIFKADYKKQFIVISPDAGAMNKTEVFAGKVGLNVAILSKKRDLTKENTVTSMVLLSMGGTNCEGRTGLIIDDMLDTGGTLMKTIAALKKNGIKDVIVAVTHGIMSGPAIDRINECDDLKSVIVSDSLDQTEHMMRCPKLSVYSLAPLLSCVIKRLIEGGSISDLFNEK